MKVFLPIALQVASSSFWLLASVYGKPNSLRGTAEAGMAINDLMIKNQLSVPLQLTEGYFYPGPNELSSLPFQYYYGSTLNYVHLQPGKNSNLMSTQNNPVEILPPSSDAPGGYSITLPECEQYLDPLTNLTLVFEPMEAVDGLQVAVVHLNMGTLSNRVTAEFLQGSYSLSSESFWNELDDTKICTFNNGNTKVYYNQNLCGYIGGPTLFSCPPDPLIGYHHGQTACLPQSNSSTGFAEVIEGDLNEPNADITVLLTEVAYKNAYTNWKPVASSGSQSLSMTTSWSTSSSTTHNTTHSSSFSASVSEKVTFKYGFAKSTTQVGASTNQYVSESTSNSISQTNSGSSTVTCDPSPCDGILYQWNVNAEDNYGNEATVQSCDFQCVPFLSAEYPRCPLGYCSSPACNCCNGIWMADDTSSQANFLDSRLPGGTCVAFEVAYPSD